MLGEQNPKDMVNKRDLKEKYATEEEPNTGAFLSAEVLEDAKLSKGKSMPSLR